MKRTLFMTFAAMLLSTLMCEAQVIYKNQGYQWKGNTITQGKFTGKAVSATKVTSDYVPIPPKMEVWNDMNPKEINRRVWIASVDVSNLPQYTSDNLLDNALYNMALEESVKAIEPDSTFRTGIAWGGVWTRDVSYSIIHSLAQLHPEVAMKSLRAKVTRNNRIIQDTGTGGAWPCSTDRVIWAVAAWEIYKVTGDRQWLDYIYPIIRNTLQDDAAVVYDRRNQLMRGETSYMDWRQQEYPEWMEPADIYSSETAVDNAVHYLALRSMVEICTTKGLGDEAERWAREAEGIRKGMMAHLWNEEKGCFAIYLYGRRFPILADQTDVMGNALAILSGLAADKAKVISEHVPCEAYGTPCIYPNLKDQYPYHNDATWPFVQGYWMRAVAKAGNEQALLHSIGALYRGAALWLSNEENYEITTGDYQLTKLNSPRQLWSVAAQAAIVPHIYFGIQYLPQGMEFTPFVPKALKGNRSLKNFRYRGATLDMSIHGYGTEIKSFLLDGEEANPSLPGNITGHHTIDIILANNTPEKMKVNMVENAYLPLTPKASLKNGTLAWEATEGSAKYQVYRNGKVVGTTDKTSYSVSGEGEYAVCGVSADGIRGYICAPVDYYKNMQVIEARNFGIPTGDYLDLTRNRNVSVTVPVDIAEEGDYSIDCQYSNGAGSVTTANKCATRLLRVDRYRGALVLPQRGENNWDEWGWSNKQTVHLTAGHHVISIDFTDQTENMNLDFNCAHLKSVRLIKL